MTTRGRNTDIYQKKTHRQHVYDRPENYAGNDERESMTSRVYDFDTAGFKNVTLDLPEAVCRIYLEVLSNAGDNMVDTMRQLAEDPTLADDGITVNPIQVTMDRKTITIFNTGLPIPIEKGKTHDHWIPEF